jgi:hypothetical protein
MKDNISEKAFVAVLYMALLFHSSLTYNRNQSPPLPTLPPIESSQSSQ